MIECEVVIADDKKGKPLAGRGVGIKLGNCVPSILGNVACSLNYPKNCDHRKKLKKITFGSSSIGNFVVFGKRCLSNPGYVVIRKREQTRCG